MEVIPTIYSRYIFTLYLSIPIPCPYNKGINLTCHANHIAPNTYNSFSPQEVETTSSFGLGQARSRWSKIQPPTPVLALGLDPGCATPGVATVLVMFLFLEVFKQLFVCHITEDLFAFGDPTRGVEHQTEYLVG